MSVFVVAKFKVHSDKMHEFGPVGRRFCDIIVARTGWKLVAAMASVTGIDGECSHIWEVPDANSLMEMESKLQPEDVGALTEVMSYIYDIDHQIHMKLEYHPES